jgi:predicted NBD/HSP70 family sugar kinase
MAERLLALGDCGGTNTRVMIFNEDGHPYRDAVFPTVIPDYIGSVQRIADAIEEQSAGLGEVVSASIAIAATSDESGLLIQAGELTPWVGHNFAGDIATALSFPKHSVGAPNDVEAIGISQQDANAKTGQLVNGVAATLSTGFNTAYYEGKGAVRGGEEGHEHLREGAICTCGQEGHVEAWITGGGVEKNQGLPMKEWLGDPKAENQLVQDIAVTFVNLLERQKQEHRFTPVEVRWTGSVAIWQPFVIQRSAALLREHMGSEAPRFDMATYAFRAGLHGTYVDAIRRMRAA